MDGSKGRSDYSLRFLKHVFFITQLLHIMILLVDTNMGPFSHYFHTCSSHRWGFPQLTIHIRYPHKKKTMWGKIWVATQCLQKLKTFVNNKGLQSRQVFFFVAWQVAPFCCKNGCSLFILLTAGTKHSLCFSPYCFPFIVVVRQMPSSKKCSCTRHC